MQVLQRVSEARGQQVFLPVDQPRQRNVPVGRTAGSSAGPTELIIHDDH